MEQERIYSPDVTDIQLSVPFSQRELTSLSLTKSNSGSKSNKPSPSKISQKKKQGAEGHRFNLTCMNESDKEVDAYFQFKCRCIVVLGITLTSFWMNYKQLFLAPVDANFGGENSKWGTMSPDGEVVGGFRDLVLEYFEPLNQFFIREHYYRHMLLIFSSGILDIMQIIQFYRWARYGTTWRMIIGAVVFYSFRAALQSVWLIEKPPGYAWDYPGVVSFYVGYGTTTDFFYSGHVGICVTHFLEYKRVGWTKMKYFAIFVGMVETFTLVVLRSHYTIDIIAGVVIGHYLFMRTEENIHLVDWGFFRIPTEKAMYVGNVDFMAPSTVLFIQPTKLETTDDEETGTSHTD